MFRITRRVPTAALLAPLVWLALSASSYAAMACKAMGVIRSECCCPASKVAGGSQVEASRQAHVDAPGCCTSITVEVDRPASTAARETSSADALPVLLPQVLAVGSLPNGEPTRRPPLDARPKLPGGGRAILLAKRSFLI